MATARRKPTPPAKKPTRADERSEVHGVRVKSPARKRALENGGGASRPPAIKPGATAARKPARRAADERPRAPRSTKRSALPEAVATPHAPKRRARRARHEDGAENKRAAARGAATGHAPAKARRRAENNPLATSIGLGVGAALLAPSGELRALVRDAGSARPDHEPDAAGRVMELHWGDDVPSSRRSEGIVQRWVKRGDALLRHLAEHGAARHEYRADLKDGRFVWVDADGRVSAEAQVQVLCSWSRSTSALAMAWADPLVRAAGIGRVDGMPAERDDVDEEAAWRVAMEAADIARAEYLYRVTTPHAWYFLALVRPHLPPRARLVQPEHARRPGAARPRRDALGGRVARRARRAWCATASRGSGKRCSSRPSTPTAAPTGSPASSAPGAASSTSPSSSPAQASTAWPQATAPASGWAAPRPST